ncbi:sugar nucleotide-binding protein [Candidatus Neptunochlamydia vexilliferae]|uniref:dTDP-4-dehydrorhamnose reductase n=1 Tax=Candidatus Neptunichlamydia vexilliferae TaxID=1651774 RepID=A0ABS0AY40_9BACT|nr:sugar nucleotide-binding protein [Candidatus Neptunochlamydia vexilliferae]MBF5059054.1 hypothetical protein [Candidatus Neptunochlamydia vexilliferae]
MNQKILLIGKRSFVGSYILQALAENNYSVIATGHKKIDSPHRLNLLSPSIAHLPLEGCTHAIITAGITNILSCEKNPELSYRCNVEGPLALAKQLHEKGVCPVLFSSDCIFDGLTGDYSEKSPPSPLNHYSKQKAELEKAIPKSCNNQYLMLRISKAYSTNPGDGALIDTIVEPLIHGKPIRAATDQIFSPILVSDLAKITVKLIRNNHHGLFNITGQETFSRYQLAKIASEKLLGHSRLVVPIRIEELSTSVKRSKNTSLSPQKLSSCSNFSFSSFQDALKIYFHHPLSKLYFKRKKTLSAAKSFIENHPPLYFSAKTTLKVLSILKMPSFRRKFKHILFNCFNSFYFHVLYHYFSKELSKVPLDQQVFIICRHDLGAIAITLHYAALWSRTRGPVVIFDISPEPDFVRAVAKNICSECPVISYKGFLFHNILLKFAKSIFYLKTLIKVTPVLISERANAIMLYNIQDFLKIKQKDSIGEYNRYFDPNASILKTKPQPFQKGYYQFRANFLYNYRNYNDYKDLIYQSDPISPNQNLKNLLNQLKKDLKISESFVVLNLNRKEYNNKVMNRRSIHHVERFDPLIDDLIGRGFSVVIHGREEQPVFKPRPHLIDYSKSPYISIENDFALLSGAAFMISSKTGPETFASCFHTPILGIDYVEPAVMIHNPKYRYVYKKVRNPDTGEILSIKELLNDAAFFDFGVVSANERLEYLEMSEEDLLAAIQEFTPLVSQPTDKWLEYTEKQKEFLNCIDSTHIDLFHCKAVPCDFFLRQILDKPQSKELGKNNS